MKLKRITIAFAVVVLSAIFPVSANAAVDTNTYVTSVPNVPATSLTAGTCPAGQIISGANCVTRTSSVPVTYSKLCQSHNGETFPAYSFMPQTSFDGFINCAYRYLGNNHYHGLDTTGLTESPAGEDWLSITANPCPTGSTQSGANCVVQTVNNLVANVTTYSCPSGYVLTGVNCMSATYSTINATPIWSSVQGWFLGSLIPKVVALTFIAIGIFLTINTVRRNGKKLI